MGRHAVFWTLRNLPNVQKGRRNLPVSKLTGHSCIPPGDCTSQLVTIIVLNGWKVNPRLFPWGKLKKS